MAKVEVGLIMPNDINYYIQLLKNNNNVIFEQTIETWDSYYTNIDLNGLSEKEMKDSCIRNRNVVFYGKTLDKNKYNKSPISYRLQNLKLINKDDVILTKAELDDALKQLDKLGFKKNNQLTTHKIDYQIQLNNMKSVLQFQLIDNIGLVLYYDNPDYYDLPEKEQRDKIIVELNSYGLDIDKDQLGIDKLRTLFYKENKYSLNQNS